MKQRRYRVTVEHIAEPDGSAPAAPRALSFEAGNHDDILALVERVRARGDLPEADAAAFTVGLKLFSEVMLQNRTMPLFADFAPQFRAFMQQPGSASGWRQRHAPVEPKHAHRGCQCSRLLAKTGRRGRRLLDQSRVLLRHPVQFTHRAVDVAQSFGLEVAQKRFSRGAR